MAQLKEANVVIVGWLVELRVEDGVDGLVLVATRLDGEAADVFADGDAKALEVDAAQRRGKVWLIDKVLFLATQHPMSYWRKVWSGDGECANS